MRLVLSGSIKFKSLLEDLHHQLLEAGHFVYNPFSGPYDVQDLQPDCPIKGISRFHWENLVRAEGVIIVNPNLYMGRKTQDTMNYANSKHKKVYFYCGGPHWRTLVR